MFGANLRLLSQDYPSISELARRLGINRTQFNRYLSGESFPRPDILDRICSFFDVDARILLEPVSELSRSDDILTGPFLGDYVGASARGLPESFFPSGFYRFSRRSFINASNYVIGILFAFRRGDGTYIRGYETKEAMHQQFLPADARSREFRGYIARQEEGVIAVMSRRAAMTGSFNYLNRVASFENNFWVGYVTRTVAESPGSNRVERMVYEHLGRDIRVALPAARHAGYCGLNDLPPFHARFLQPDVPFR